MRTVGICAAIALAACGSNPTADYPSFAAASANQYCQRLVDCGLFDGAYQSVCVQEASEPNIRLIAAHVRFDPAAAQRCLDAAQAALADCSALNQSNPAAVAACGAVITGSSPPGSPCPFDVECAPGSHCARMFDTAKHCTSSCVADPAPSGCDLSGCPVGQVCDSVTHACESQPDGGAPRKAMGQPCASSGECATPLVCLGESTGAGTCEKAIPKGGSCPGDGCLQPHGCVAGVCTPPPVLGDPCDAGLCLIGYCNPATHKCEPLPGPGAACDPTAMIPLCGADTVCDPPSRTCQYCQ
jgi:hypothetical protein